MTSKLLISQQHEREEAAVSPLATTKYPQNTSEHGQLLSPLNSKKPILRGKVHLILLIIAPIWIYPLFQACKSLKAAVAVTMASCAAIFNFAASATLHGIKWKSTYSKLIATKIDHAAIFLMICASACPVSALLMSGIRWSLYMIMDLGTASIGIWMAFTKNFTTTENGWIRATTYISVGLLQGLIFIEIIPKLLISEIIFLFGLAIFYIIGAMAYASKWPKGIPNIFGSHDIFHFCCFISAICTLLLNLSVLNRIG